MAARSNGPLSTNLIIHEDPELLVVNKPPGWNTHAPSPYGGEGAYEWLKHRTSRWSSLAIIHRLDKETSGLLIFSKTDAANRSLTAQFTNRAVRKRYVFLTDRPVPNERWVKRSIIRRTGDRYRSIAGAVGEPPAETEFRTLGPQGQAVLVEARPLTGKTHQIRVHAADSGCPILGDTLYGGTPHSRLCLHAASVTLDHPTTHVHLQLEAPVDFQHDPRLWLREAIIDWQSTNCCRLLNGAADGCAGLYVDLLGEHLLAQSASALAFESKEIRRLESLFHSTSVHAKHLDTRVRNLTPGAASPRLVRGLAPGEAVELSEHGIKYEASFQEGYSVGLFLDQRENRRRVLENHVASGFPLLTVPPAEAEVLNTFAYTCSFSVCAAKLGARTVSVDLSRKYLAWGQRNFARNGLSTASHEFLFGDVFSWLGRFNRRGRRFDLIILDPPTFSTSREGGRFSAEKDYGRLMEHALKVLKPAGVILASTNAAAIEPDRFVQELTSLASRSPRRVVQSHFVPQPPDFPSNRAEPAYLKTFWLRVA